MKNIDIDWYYTIIVFCWGQYEFLWTLKIIFTEAFRLRWILISKVHKISYWPIQKTVIVLLQYNEKWKWKWNQVNTSFNQTISNFTECQVTAW